MENIVGNFFLIGLMGAGKTTLGKELAKALNRPFYDSDHVICERTGVSIPTIFEMEGEQGFRDRESSVIDDLTKLSPIVLATGGGAPLRKQNRDYLCSRGTVIYLHTLPSLLLERTRHDKNRPLLQVADPLAKLQELYNERDGIYRSIAHITLEANQQNSQKSMEKLFEALNHLRK